MKENILKYRELMYSAIRASKLMIRTVNSATGVYGYAEYDSDSIGDKVNDYTCVYLPYKEGTSTHSGLVIDYTEDYLEMYEADERVTATGRKCYDKVEEEVEGLRLVANFAGYEQDIPIKFERCELTFLCLLRLFEFYVAYPRFRNNPNDYLQITNNLNIKSTTSQARKFVLCFLAGIKSWLDNADYEIVVNSEGIDTFILTNPNDDSSLYYCIDSWETEYCPGPYGLHGYIRPRDKEEYFRN